MSTSNKWFSRYNLFYTKVKELIPNDAKVLVVGANDGVTYDPIRQVWNDNWWGYYVEPNPTAMKNLRKNITSPNSTFIPHAMGLDGTIYLYTMTKEAANAYAQHAHIDGSSITSVKYEHVANGLIKHAPKFVRENGGTDNLIQRIEYSSVSFTTIVEKYQIDRLDIVQIDVEEIDDLVLRSVLNGLHLLIRKPKIILYEHQRMQQDRKELTWRWLRASGYKVVELRNDTMGYRT